MRVPLRSTRTSPLIVGQGMNTVTKGYDFTLTRTQRLLTLAAEWWRAAIVLCVFLVALVPIAVQYSIVGIIILLVLLFFFRGLLFGVFDLFNDGRRHVEVEDRGVGFGRESADCWIFTDGIRQIRRNRWGTISIRHHNGTYVDVPADMISSDDYTKLEAGMKVYYGQRNEQPNKSP